MYALLKALCLLNPMTYYEVSLTFHNVLVRGNTEGGAVELAGLRLGCAKPLIDTKSAILRKIRKSSSHLVGTQFLAM